MKTVLRKPYTKRCPECSREYGRTKSRCECGHVFKPTQGLNFGKAFQLMRDVGDFLAQNENAEELIEQLRSLVERAGGWDGLAEALETAKAMRPHTTALHAPP